MSSRRFFHDVFALLVITMLLASLARPALASDANKSNCLRGPQGCKIGVENLECGAGGGQTGWHCKSTWTNKCLCFEYGTSKHGWWWSVSTDWQTQPSAPLVPNSVVTLQTLPAMAGNDVIVWETGDPAPDSASAEVHAGPSDLNGFVRIRLLNGPPDAIPVQIELIQLSLVSVNYNSSPTGPNLITLGSPSSVPGLYDSVQQILDFNQAVPCTLRNNLFPQGHLIDIRPRAIPGLPGRYLFDLSATLWIGNASGVPDAQLSPPEIAVRPNVSSEGTTILLTLPEPMGIALDVFDVSGRLVLPLVRESRPGGVQTIEWNGRDAYGNAAATGIYFLRLKSGSGYEACERFTLVR